MESSNLDMRQAILLDPLNATPLARTPWAGDYINEQLKAHVLPAEQREQPIGESWEFSLGPEFPSRLLGQERTLADLMAQASAHRGQWSLPEPMRDMLIKIISTAEPLSLQVHPSDEDPLLADDECGKPETWLVVRAEPGAGVYLGFKEPVSPSELEHVMRNRPEQLPDLFNFIPVKTNDLFDIPPGTPHAIGPGITLIEPQRNTANKKGVTYRMWDWGRKYTINGQRDDLRGRARALHTERALATISAESYRSGSQCAQHCYRRAEEQYLNQATTLFSFPANDYCQMYRLTSSLPLLHRQESSAGIVGLSTECSLRLSCELPVVAMALEGSVAIEHMPASAVSRTAESSLTLKQGMTCLLPEPSLPIRLGGSYDLVLITDPSAKISIDRI